MWFNVNRQTFNATSRKKSLLDYEVLDCYWMVRDFINAQTADCFFKSTDDSQSLKDSLNNYKTLSTRFLFKSRAHQNSENKIIRFNFIFRSLSSLSHYQCLIIFFQNKHSEVIRTLVSIFPALFRYVRK